MSTPASLRQPIRLDYSIESAGGARRAWLVDLWGVLHNGLTAYPLAVAACQTFRGRGGVVVLLSNAPRPWSSVADQLDRIGVPRDAWDAIVTSGDASRPMIAASNSYRVFHLGPERDIGLYDGLTVTLSDQTNADLVVCTGLFDDEADAVSDYRETLTALAARSVPMICANPDLRVERGSRIVPCAGAVAKLYEELGGAAAYAGKPYLPVYDMAFAVVDRLAGEAVDRAAILAIGDGISTDIAGAAAAGIDSVFVASGIHMESGETLSQETLSGLFGSGESRPIAALAALAW